jgi:hypothetical protein
VALAIYFVFFVVSSAVAEAAVEPEVAVVAATIADAEFLVAAIEANVRGGAVAAEEEAAVAALGRFLLIITGVQS